MSLMMAKSRQCKSKEGMRCPVLVLWTSFLYMSTHTLRFAAGKGIEARVSQAALLVRPASGDDSPVNPLGAWRGKKSECCQFFYS